MKNQKIKKKPDNNAGLTLELVENPDILATVARQTPRPFCVGFAAETQDVARYARDKIQRKNLDMIVANDVSQAGIGFNSHANAVTVIWGDGEQILETASKFRIAQQVITIISERFKSA